MKKLCMSIIVLFFITSVAFENNSNLSQYEWSEWVEINIPKDVDKSEFTRLFFEMKRAQIKDHFEEFEIMQYSQSSDISLEEWLEEISLNSVKTLDIVNAVVEFLLNE